MKVSLEQMHQKFMSLSQNRSDEIARIYANPFADCLDREEQWAAILDDAPSNRGYLVNALGLGHDVAEEPEPSADDKAAAIAVKNPTATRAELQAEVAAKAAPVRRPPRSDQEIAEALYGRGR